MTITIIIENVTMEPTQAPGACVGFTYRSVVKKTGQPEWIALFLFNYTHKLV